MEEWVGKSCKLCVERNGEFLFFTVNQVLSVSEFDITFLDRLNDPYTFRRRDVVQIKPS